MEKDQHRGGSSSSWWIHRQRDSFGYPFLICCCVVYFAQGFRSLSGLSIQFLLKDTMQLAPASIQGLLSTAALPWSLKPLYGLVSDSFPINGRHRKPYLVIAAFLGVFAWCTLAFITHAMTDSPASSMGLITTLLCLSNFSTALSDVIVDAMVAERCGELARASSEAVSEGEDALQSLCWGSLAVGGLVGSLLGILTASAPPWCTFLATAVCPGFVLVASYALTESSSSKSKLPDKESGFRAISRQLRSLSEALCKPSISGPLLFFFLRNAMVPSCSQAMFFFSTDVLHFSKEFLNMQLLLGYACLLLGTTVFSHYIAKAGYGFSQIFLYCQVATLGMCLLDVLLVSRFTSTYLGLPDRAFVLGTDVFGTLLDQFSSRPFFLIAARLCPPGCEGTLYALFMSVFNFGNTVSSVFGAFVTPLFGVEEGRYDGLTWLLMLRAFCTLLPLMLIKPLLKGVDRLKDE